ncbi:MAG: SDR family NAD(P)-dependent oxidoreductase [Phycisphaerales bacterium]
MKLWTNDAEARLRTAYADQRVCVTGGAGFIGSHLVDCLLNLGASVAIIDDLSTGDAEYPAHLIDKWGDRVRFIYASILEPPALRAATENASVVFHLAAIGSVPQSISEPERTMDVNLTGTVRVAEAARRAKSRRLVFASSSAIYGDTSQLPITEDAPIKPMSPYAASKAAAEHVVRAWSASYALSGVSLRYFNIFGPRQSADNQYAAVIPAFISAIASGKHPTINGDGSFTRDFAPVANAVYANLLAGASTSNLTGQAVNIACAAKTSIKQLAEQIASLMGRPDLDPAFAPPRKGDIPHSVASIDAARKLLGYEPIATPEQGLRELVEWAQMSAEQRAKAEPCG